MKHKVELLARAGAPGNLISYKCTVCGKQWGLREAVDLDEDCPGPQDPKSD